MALGADVGLSLDQNTTPISGSTGAISINTGGGGTNWTTIIIVVVAGVVGLLFLLKIKKGR